MREIGRRCPRAQLIQHQRCSRCLARCVMRNFTAKRERRLNQPLPPRCTHHVNNDTGEGTRHVPRVKK